jgi:hypothetical protein
MSKDHCRQTDQDNASKNCYGIKRRDVLLSGGSVIAASAFIGEASVIAANKPANAQATAATSAALDTDATLESYSAEFEDTAPRRPK